VESTLALIRNQPPESFEHQEIKYLIEPEVPKGALVLVTGSPGSGKSTLVMHWSMQMALAGNEVLYLDRDNPLFIAQERIERFGGKTVDGLMYWGLLDQGRVRRAPGTAISRLRLSKGSCAADEESGGGVRYLRNL
jgi:energy-coupling factor transporter ATP-binding protein EcfA2